MYDAECGMTMEPMHGKWTSSRVDLGYTELFCVPEVTSVFFSSCDSFLGDSLEFNQANQSSLRVCFGTRNCSALSAGQSGLILQRRGSLMGFLELWQEPGLHSQVIVGLAIQNSSLFSKVRTPV